MNDVLTGVLDDLAAETAALDDAVSGLDDPGWRASTPAEGWDVAHQIVHLAWTDEAAVLAARAGQGDKGDWDALVIEAIGDPMGYVDSAAAEGARAAGAEILNRWRTARQQLWQTLADYPDAGRLPWFGPPMSPTSMATARFMETWAHALDVYDGLGIDVAPADRVRHVVHLGVRTRGFAFVAHELEPPVDPVRVELVLPSGATWANGPEEAAQSVTGSAYDFALRVTQRRHLDDLDLVATGADAQRWLEIAQAFAGPPGGGREAKGGTA